MTDESATPEGSVRPAPKLEPGEVVAGNYRIRELIGEGGMGSIFDATDELLQRRVALKLPFTEEGSVALMLEARALAALAHPHLPMIFGAGVTGGLNYVVMERLRGESLERHLEARRARHEPFSVLGVVRLLGTIADVLHAIHEAGILHRDVKPANVMLVPGRGPVLIDFGLVVPRATAHGDRTVSGSPHYMAPEVITGAVSRGNGRQVDLYSFGVMAFELLAGVPPFSADELHALLRMHVEAPVPDVRLLRPDAPAALATLISELMRKEPGQRPESAEEVRWELGRIDHQLAAREVGVEPQVVVVTALEPLARGLADDVKGWVRGADVKLFTEAPAALAHLEARRPRLVLLDTKLQGVSAAELLMQLESFPNPPPVVALALDLKPEDARVLGKLGVVCCLPIGKQLAALLEPKVRGAFATAEPA
ncbi:MAG: serine/threonine-protein kinase [Sorangiineae bacterium]|nr:serine/threonine-protein kinase [Polyangiaceae bacterium]MEB2324692.1 serine/threonine-protein kinase [Sorangiineae bacterium]